MRLKKNNSGFTLIELLVSIAILAIVMIPLMHSFITAAQTNLKSRRILEATAVGQNIMENIKAEKADAFQSAPWQADTDENGEACFSQSNTDDTTINGRKFYVRAYLNGENFTSQTATPAATDYNSMLWATMSNLSKANNAFLIMKPNEADLVVNDMYQMLPPSELNSVNVVDIRKNVEREITVNVSHVPDSGLSIVKMSVKYKYTSTSSGNTYEYLALDNQEMYNNGTNLSNVLSGVFICYYPLYYGLADCKGKETVTIENPGNYPLDVYLVKQEGSGTRNSSYHVNLDIKEDAALLGTENAGVSVTNVVTNLDCENSGSELQISYGYGVTAGEQSSGAQGLERGEAVDRIYIVKLKVYELKDGGVYEAKDVLTELESTKIE